MTHHHRARCAIAALALCATAAHANVQITEFQYNGLGDSNGAGRTSEFVELTNLGSTAVNFAGWSFDDVSRTPGSFSLSALGVVAAGESVLITEGTAAAFRSAWNLAPTVKIAGGNTQNLGRSDEINIYDANGALVDRLTYGDQDLAGTVRAATASANPLALADLAPTTISSQWVLAHQSDSFGSVVSVNGDYANPGVFLLSAVPEPASLALLLGGLGLVAGVARRRNAGAAA